MLSEKDEVYGCNCGNKNTCPLENKCLTPKVVYRAEITNDKDQENKTYIGLTETPFKDRYRNHVKSFNNKKYQKETELSKYIWELKDDHKEPMIKWSILKSINFTNLPCGISNANYSCITFIYNLFR